MQILTVLRHLSKSSHKRESESERKHKQINNISLPLAYGMGDEDLDVGLRPGRADQHKVQGLTRPGVKDTIDREALPCTGNAARDEDRIRTWLSRFATLTFRARSGHLSTCCACSTLFHAHRYGALKALLMRTV